MGDKAYETDKALMLAEDRTVMANERTFAGWTRTGVSMVGLALGTHYVLGQTEPAWLAKMPAMGLILLSLFVYWAAWQKSRKTFNRLREHATQSLGEHEITTTAVGLAIVSTLIGGLIWMI